MRSKSRGKSCIAILASLILGASSLTVYADGEKSMIDTVDKSAEEIVGQMDLNEKIGQMLMPAIRTWNTGQKKENVTVLREEISKAYKDFNLGGIILFAENFDTKEKAIQLTTDLQNAAKEGNGIPLLIGTDQEGGPVVRLPFGTRLPGNMALGANPNEEDSFTAGTILGAELSESGINVDFAPDLDINSNPKNPVIGVRSFSSSPDLVTSLGLQILQGIKSKGVATAIKHFPGHGDTATDSHSALPLVDKSYEELQNFELIPFRAAMDQGADMVMIAHIQYPQIETQKQQSIKEPYAEVNLPATLSKTIVTDILRGDMKFSGVVITDAMNMKALADNFTQEDTAKLAINAGVDILLMPVTIEDQQGINDLKAYIESIAKMVESGDIAESRITEAATRIMQMKIDRGLMNGAVPLADNTDYHAVEREITRKAITVTQNKSNTLPLKPMQGETVLLLGAYENELPALEYGFKLLQEEGAIDAGVSYKLMSYTGSQGKKDIEKLKRVKEAIKTSNFVITVSELGAETHLSPEHWICGSVDEIIAAGKEQNVPTAVLSIGQPYDAARYADADAIAIAYGAAGMTMDENGKPVGAYGANIPTALDILFGAVEPIGKLPVDVMRIDETYHYTNEIQYPLGFSITDIKAAEGDVVVESPAEATDEVPFETVVKLRNMEAIAGEGFTFTAHVAPEFEVKDIKMEDGGTVSWNMDGQNVIISGKPGEQHNRDEIKIAIALQAKTEGKFVPITLQEYKDVRQRNFSLQVTSNNEVQVIHKENPGPAPKPTPTPTPTPTPDKKEGVIKTPRTGDDSAIHYFLLLVGAGFVLLLSRRYK